MYCKRHNEAARLVADAVVRHGGPSSVIQQHVGWKDAVDDAPPSTLAGARDDEVRPDLTLRRGKHTLMVEVKYGQDTRLEDKLDGIRRSYAPALRRLGRGRASLLVVLLGVGGRIPTDTVRHLEELGMSSRNVASVAAALNTLAVTWLHRLVVTRRLLERIRQPP